MPGLAAAAAETIFDATFSLLGGHLGVCMTSMFMVLGSLAGLGGEGAW